MQAITEEVVDRVRFSQHNIFNDPLGAFWSNDTISDTATEDARQGLGAEKVTKEVATLGS